MGHDKSKVPIPKKRIKRMLIGVILVPIALLIFVVFLPVILVVEIKEYIALRTFCRREAGNFYLICTSRRGWYDFLKNNLIPILPKNVKVVWHTRTSAGKNDPIFLRILSSGIYGVPKPYIISVQRKCIKAYSLNNDLQIVKKHPKKSVEIQVQTQNVINVKIKGAFANQKICF
jgi:hypothetical protein